MTKGHWDCSRPKQHGRGHLGFEQVFGESIMCTNHNPLQTHLHTHIHTHTHVHTYPCTHMGPPHIYMYNTDIY